MRFDKNRLALLAGIDNRDQYFGKTLNENFSHGLAVEAEDDLDAAEDAEDDVPLDADGDEEEAALEDDAEVEMVSKEEVADAMADILGVDAAELAALVSGDEAEPEGDAEEASDEDPVEDLELEAHYEGLRRTIRKEIAAVINEARRTAATRRIRAARRTKSVAVAMGFKKTRK
jgi:hypothetical protein